MLSPRQSFASTELSTELADQSWHGFHCSCASLMVLTLHKVSGYFGICTLLSTCTLRTCTCAGSWVVVEVHFEVPLMVHPRGNTVRARTGGLRSTGKARTTSRSTASAHSTALSPRKPPCTIRGSSKCTSTTKQVPLQPVLGRVLGTWYMPGTWYLALARHLPGAGYLPSTCQVLGTWYLVLARYLPGTWYLVLARYLPSTCQVLGTWYLVLVLVLGSEWYWAGTCPVLGTLYLYLVLSGTWSVLASYHLSSTCTCTCTCV